MPPHPEREVVLDWLVPVEGDELPLRHLTADQLDIVAKSMSETGLHALADTYARVAGAARDANGTTEDIAADVFNERFWAEPEAGE